MKKLMKLGFMATLMGAMIFFTGCDDNEVLIAPVEEPEKGYDATISMVEGDNNKTVTIFADDVDSTVMTAIVSFEATTDNMKRLYITENFVGQGAEPYEIANTDTKLDGSIDLSSSTADSLAFIFSFPKNTSLTGGTIEYKLWATSGRGDFRDSDKRLLVGVATIVIDYGGTNEASVVKNYTAKMFVVPLADGSSQTFVSVLNGDMYKLSDGEEYASFWDFGYYWLDTPGSSLSSTSAYPALFDHDNDANTALVAISDLTGTPQDELNNCYFAGTTMTSSDFDAVAVSSDLSGISVSSSSAEKAQNLAVDDIVAFMDSYGKKGLIRVVSIVPGYGSDGEMVIDIKVQP